MSWHFSQALVAAYSAATCSDGVPSAPSSATPTPSAYCSPDRMTAVSRLSRSGMTFQPLTADHGEAVLTWCRAASLVRTSAPPDEGQESPAPGPAYGERWRESFAKYDPDSCSWRTRQCSLFEGLTSSSVTWPRWGSMRNGECSERTTPELPTSGSGSGSLLPTPLASNTKAHHMRSGGREARSYLPAPMSSDAKRTDCPSERERSSPSLVSAVHMFPTPTTIDSGSRFNTSLHPGAEPRPTLGAMARHGLWRTPCAADHRDRGHVGSPAILRRKEKGKQTALSATVSATSGALNPEWTEWLMAWPLGWTDLSVSATARFRQWRRSHGAS
jgi:hypothetical protein